MYWLVPARELYFYKIYQKITKARWIKMIMHQFGWITLGCPFVFLKGNHLYKFSDFLCKVRVVSNIKSDRAKSTKLHVLHAHEPPWLACLCTHMPMCFACLCAHLPTCLACLHTHVPTCLVYLHAHVSTCLVCLCLHAHAHWQPALCAYVLMCQCVLHAFMLMWLSA